MLYFYFGIYYLLIFFFIICKILNQMRRNAPFFLYNKLNVNLKNKLNLYKTLLRPVRSYGIQFWTVAKPLNIQKIQIFQSTTLHLITGATF